MNPRAALTTYSLSRGAPSASLGTSPKRPLFNIHDIRSIVQYFFYFFSNLFFTPNIRCSFLLLYTICSALSFIIFYMILPILYKEAEFLLIGLQFQPRSFSRHKRERYCLVLKQYRSLSGGNYLLPVIVQFSNVTVSSQYFL